MTKRASILAVFQTRLAAILITDGFETNAGLALFRGEAPAMGPDDPEVAIAMIVGEDSAGYQGEHIVIDLPIEIQVLAKADLAAPWEAIEAVLGDVKKAIELPDRTLGQLVMRQIRRGTTRTLEREQGSTAVGIAIAYVAPYRELWGVP